MVQTKVPVLRFATLGAFGALVLMLAGVALAQTADQPKPVPTPHSRYTPFSSEWSKPSAETGGYIYMDPRIQSGNQRSRPNGTVACPSGRTVNPTNGTCY